ATYSPSVACLWYGHVPAVSGGSFPLNHLVALDFPFHVVLPYHTSIATAPGPFVKPFTTFAIVVFSLVAVLHVLRLIFGWEVVINGLVMPMWVSVVGFLVAGGVAVMVRR